MNPGSSVMMIAFEGIYVETEENGGERLMCLLGSSNSIAPSTNRCDCDEFSEFASSYISTYRLLRSRTCDPFPYQDELMEDGAMMFTGEEFCRGHDHLNGEIINIVPNYRFKGNYMGQIHGKLGSFLLGKEMEATGGMSYDDIKLIVQHVKCEQDTTSNRIGNAKVSAVLRAVPTGSFQHFEVLRTGLSGLTLAAEGIWNSSSGQLSWLDVMGRLTQDWKDVIMKFPCNFHVHFPLSREAFCLEAYPA
ncbi:Protein of unknown function DUF2921 - like 8 [Theobroma cacao]|nr:Protein of unknown function DUF2921 - like 8 [Theobroma cacao]